MNWFDYSYVKFFVAFVDFTVLTPEYSLQLSHWLQLNSGVPLPAKRCHRENNALLTPFFFFCVCIPIEYKYF